MDFDPRTGLEVVDAQECFTLLSTTSVGRLAALVDGRVELWPMNFAAAEGSIFIRTAPGTKMDAVGGTDVVFEVDAVSDRWESGWSVILRGTLVEVTDPVEVGAAELLGLRTWSLSGKSRWLRLDPDEIGGRRVVKTSGDYTD
jgi:nitroimidazol reductase NimA-like FMN-containing flavoprotein (pyridoxamine 5'-phosphate oxidase superfamily)